MSLKIALAQLNPTVGDIAGNVVRLLKAWEEAATQGADLLLTPEMFLSGYPPEDLVLKPSFQRAIVAAIEDLAQKTLNGGPALLVGAPWRENGNLYNAMLLLDQGRIAARVFKRDLPNYGPFDEKRVFASAPLPEPVLFRDVKLGVLICEDMWTPDAAVNLGKKGATILLVPNGSPYESGKAKQRLKLARQRVTETGLSLVYLNQIGGQDELVFDGASFVVNAKGAVILAAKAWAEDLVLLTINKENGMPACACPTVPFEPTSITNAESETYNALMLGLRDYVTKNNFLGVVLGLSGGIDSALVAALAVDALGAEKVWGVMMPSPYTSRESIEDAEAIAQNLGIRLSTIPITAAMQSLEYTLADVFAGHAPNVTEENIQSRLRGMILMGLSNKFGPMVLSTGNKSEMSVGYSTLYGDLCGGFAVLKDLYKTQVYRVSRWRNTERPATGHGPQGAVIPERIFTKAPTAELKPNQTDQDSLPPYDVLDSILEGLIEKDLGKKDLIAQGHEAEMVKRVWNLLYRAEYKRRQAPPGVKISCRHLGRDRRYPITNGYRES